MIKDRNFFDRFVQKKRAPLDPEDLGKEVNDVFLVGFSLEKDIKGEIIEATLAPNETKIIPHGLRAIPKFRLILRQTGNGVITDVDDKWTDKAIGLRNNGAVSVKIIFKLM